MSKSHHRTVNGLTAESDQTSVRNGYESDGPDGSDGWMLRLTALSPEEMERTVRVLTGALLACGGWMLARTQEKGIAALDFEFARAACVEIYAVLIGCGLELSRDSHLRMAELCHCSKNLIESKAFDIARVDLIVYSNGSKRSQDESQGPAGLIGVGSTSFDQAVATLPGFAQVGPGTLFFLGWLGTGSFNEIG